MKDAECVEFLQWALPRLHLHWPGYRKVRRQVCKRVARRMRALGVANAAAYHAHLEQNPAEWQVLEGLCPIPISRFYRDRGIFGALEREVLPALAEAAAARDDASIECWSAGCAAGEEPYTLAILWHVRLKARFPALRFRVRATDIEPALLARAAAGCYRGSSLKELPLDWLDAAFDQRDALYCVREPLRRDVEFVREDIRAWTPERPFDLIACRNLVLTYFEPALQRAVMERIANALRPGGALLIGSQESLPDARLDLTRWPGSRCIYRKLAPGEASHTVTPDDDRLA